jgi:hypothetical protein
MSVLSTIGICWLGLNGAVFAALATRKSRLRVRAQLFYWVIRNELREPAPFTPAAAFARVAAGRTLFRRTRRLWEARGYSGICGAACLPADPRQCRAGFAAQSWRRRKASVSADCSIAGGTTGADADGRGTSNRTAPPRPKSWLHQFRRCRNRLHRSQHFGRRRYSRGRDPIVHPRPVQTDHPI